MANRGRARQHPRPGGGPVKPDYRSAGADRLVRPPLKQDQRRFLLLAALAVFALALFAFAGEAWAMVIFRLLADGPFLLLWLLAAAGVGSVVPLPAARAADASIDTTSADGPSGDDAGVVPTAARATDADSTDVLLAAVPATQTSPLRIVTATALGLGAFSLGTLGLGLAGALNTVTAYAMLAAGLAGGAITLVRARRAMTMAGGPDHPVHDWLRAPAGWHWLWLIVVPTLTLAVVAAMVPPGLLWNPEDPHGYDVVEYHLQIPREWYEAGRIVPLEHNVFSFFPFNVEMHYLLAMHLRGGPWAGMYLAQLMHAAFVALSVAAVFAVAGQLTASRGAPVVAAVAAAAAPWLLLLAPVAYNEGGLLLYGTLAVGWAIAALGAARGRLGAFAVAGAMAGLASGAKLTGVPMLLIAVAGVAAVVMVLFRRRLPGNALAGAVAGPAVFVLTGLLVFSPWLIRNQVWAGNPVFPEAMPLLGRGHFSPVQVERWQRAHRPRDDQQSAAARVVELGKQVVGDWRYGFVLLPLALVAAMPSYRRPAALLLFLLLVGLTVFWLAITHLQSRFFVLGIPLAALLLATVRWRPWPAVGAVLFGSLVAWGWVAAYRPVRVFVQAGVLGVDEPSLLLPLVLPDYVIQRAAPADRIVLVGDAKAFWYPFEMRRLRYRTVFDVDTSGGAGVIEAWRGKGWAPGELVIVEPGELGRFSATYYGIPPLPEPMRDRGAAFVLEPSDARE